MGKRLALQVTGLIAGLAFAVPAGVAAGTAMHPVLAARLAGMGEHGVVNLQSDATKRRLCWTFELPTTSGVTGASIRAGAKNVVLIRLGRSFARKGCVKASAMTLEHLEAAPRSYRVWVDTKGHPGDLRGVVFAGMAHM